MTYKEIQDALQDRHINIVAASTGLHRQTIRNIRSGKANPTERTLDKLRAYLGAKP